MSGRLIATTAGADGLGLRNALQQYVDEQWTANHYTDEQRRAILLDQFKRKVATDLELLGLEPEANS